MNPFAILSPERTNSRSPLARQSTASSWVYKQSSFDLSGTSSLPSDSDVFTISKSSNTSSSLAVSLPANCPTYIRHSNLDVRPLSVQERLRLARIHYLTISNGIRVCTILFCLGWFIFVSIQTLRDYTGHKTIVYLDYQNPNQTKPPAISVCSHCILCSMTADAINSTSAWRMLTEDDVSKKHLANFPASNRSHELVNINISCTLFPNTKMQNWKNYGLNCSKLVPPVESMQEGHKCFTFFSDIYGQTSRAAHIYHNLILRFDNAPRIFLEIAGQYVFGIATTPRGFSGKKKTFSFSGMYLNVHDPTILPDMYGLPFHQLSPGYEMNVPFTKRIQHLLPPPFATQCHNYKSKVHFDYSTELINSSFEFRTLGECFLHCMWNLLNKKRCANFFSIYTTEMVQKENLSKVPKSLSDLIKRSRSLLNASTSNDLNDLFKICLWNETSFYDYAQAKKVCMNNCPVPCKVNTFDDYGADNQKVNKLKAHAHIWWAPLPVTEIRHTPKWDLTDFLGTIGGQVHIWLGISVIQLVWFAIKFVRFGEVMPDAS